MGSTVSAPHEAAFLAVTAAFASLGRACLALDAGYRIRHVSPMLGEMLGSGAGLGTTPPSTYQAIACLVTLGRLKAP